MPPLTSLLIAATLAAAPKTAYQAVFMRAAPGHLLRLIDAVKARMPVFEAAGEPRPVLMRHAQGDQWDILLLVPIGGVAALLGAERAMENDFLRRIGRAGNFVSTKITGAAWDSFTIGFYRDLQHYAAPSKVSAEEEDRATRAAGFDSRNHIGPYLRQFLNGHHDTVGSVVR